MSSPAEMTALERVFAAAANGAVGAIIAAALSSVSEPIVNRILVERKTVSEAIAEHDMEKSKQFFKTTLPTNFIKFPFFEVVTALMAGVDVDPSIRGTVTGMVYTTVTLPIGNYRFRKSMNLPIEYSVGQLYQAYAPTLFRDVLYGIARNNVFSSLLEGTPDIMASAGGQFYAMFVTVLASCVLSAPGNEVRGYFLQPPDKRKPVAEFFQPVRFARSTFVGALIMAISISSGTVITGIIQPYATKQRAVLLGLVIYLYQYFNNQKKVEKA